MHIHKTCPICGSIDLIEFNNRPSSKCANCGSLERSRYMFLLLNRMGVLAPESSILHIAPEPGIASRLRQLCAGYTAAEYDRDQHEQWTSPVELIDLDNVLETVPDRYDLILHNHVLSHAKNSVSSVLAQLKDRLNPGGKMLFSVPVRQGVRSVVSQKTDAPGDQGVQQMFGELDVLDVLSGDGEIQVAMIDPYQFLAKAELGNAYVPGSVANVSGHSIFRIEA